MRKLACAAINKSPLMGSTYFVSSGEISSWPIDEEYNYLNIVDKSINRYTGNECYVTTVDVIG
jgi:hypothetical protein